ncbi:MAG: NTP transferase domain-containing protein [Flavobacteriales bacterium]|nr:NTP transferase domain-containing protein [Flavobacteriales bacterium]
MISGDSHLKGLVLAGGKSSRMGKDKALISYHNQPQFLHVVSLLENFCNAVFISCRKDQEDFFQSHNLKTIPDREEGRGPLGAIHSALLSDIAAAWIVLACDLPLADEKLVEELLAERKTDCIATSFISPHDGLPEPLIAVWERHAIKIVEVFIANGHSCPRKVLINSNTHLVQPSQPEKLVNINTPEEFAAIVFSKS